MKNRTDFIRLAFALTIIISFVAGLSLCFGEPVPGGPGFVSVGSHEFKPLDPSTPYTFIGSRLSNTGFVGVFVAPVHLPQPPLPNSSYILLIMGRPI
jgi:hypothetical protein